MKIPTLVIVRGLPGAGKSTYAKKLCKDTNDVVICTQCFHFEADHYFEEDGEYNFNAGMLGIAHAKCLINTYNALRDGDDCVVSNTFTTRKEIQPYLGFDLHYDVKIIKLSSEFESIHGIPDYAYNAMKERWENFDGEEKFRFKGKENV